MKLRKILSAFLLFACLSICLNPLDAEDNSRWNNDYNFIYGIKPIIFHFNHGILAGSYKPGQETTEVTFDDVSGYLGHVCLCGAGGYRISQYAVDKLGGGKILEKGEFVLISGRDHTVSDVISFVLGCARRNDPKQNVYFIDDTIKAPRREYHYYLAYPPLKKAVHVIYRKHLLIGHDEMDRLWKIESGYHHNPKAAPPKDLKLYRDTMVKMVKKVLIDNKTGLIEVKSINYGEFMRRLNRLKKQ